MAHDLLSKFDLSRPSLDTSFLDVDENDDIHGKNEPTHFAGHSKSKNRPALVETDNVEEGRLACPVKDCAKSLENDLQMLQHWQNFHCRKVLMFLCPVLGCEVQKKRRPDMNRHMRQHVDIFSSKEEVVQANHKISMLAQHVENPSYQPPGKAKPPFAIFPKLPPYGSKEFAQKEDVNRRLMKYLEKVSTRNNSKPSTKSCESSVSALACLEKSYIDELESEIARLNRKENDLHKIIDYLRAKLAKCRCQHNR